MGGITGHYGAGRNVVGDDAAGSDDRAFADGDAGEDGDIAAEPDIVPDGDGEGLLDTLVALLRVEGVDGGEQAAAGTYEDVGADGDGGLVEYGQIEIDIGIVTYGYLGAVVAEEGGEDDDIAAHVADERAQQDAWGAAG